MWPYTPCPPLHALCEHMSSLENSHISVRRCAGKNLAELTNSALGLRLLFEQAADEFIMAPVLEAVLQCGATIQCPVVNSIDQQGLLQEGWLHGSTSSWVLQCNEGGRGGEQEGAAPAGESHIGSQHPKGTLEGESHPTLKFHGGCHPSVTEHS